MFGNLCGMSVEYSINHPGNIFDSCRVGFGVCLWRCTKMKIFLSTLGLILILAPSLKALTLVNMHNYKVKFEILFISDNGSMNTVFKWVGNKPLVLPDFLSADYPGKLFSINVVDINYSKNVAQCAKGNQTKWLRPNKGSDNITVTWHAPFLKCTLSD